MATEKIIIQIGNEVLELKGSAKEAFLEQRAKDQADLEIRLTEEKTRQIARFSALQKLGLTEEEINAIL